MDAETEAFADYSDEVDAELEAMAGVRLHELPGADESDKYFLIVLVGYGSSEDPRDIAHWLCVKAGLF